MPKEGTGVIVGLMVDKYLVNNGQVIVAVVKASQVAANNGQAIRVPLGPVHSKRPRTIDVVVGDPLEDLG